MGKIRQNISDFLKDKVVVPDLSDYPLHKKIPAFGKFNAEQLSYVKEQLELKSELEKLVVLQRWFASINKAPTPFELKTIDAYENSEIGYSKRAISEIDVSCKNPYVRKTLEMYNERRKKSASLVDTPRTLADYAEAGSRFAFANGTDTVIKTGSGTVAEFNCYRNGRRASYFLRFWDYVNEIDAGELKLNLGRLYAYGYKPMALVYEEFDGSTPKKRLICSKTADLFGVPAFESTEKCVSKFKEPVAKTSLLCYSEHAEIFSADILGRESILLVDIERPINKTGSQVDWSFLHCRGISTVISADEGVLNGLVGLGHGFDIDIADVPLANDTEESVLLRPSSKYVVALCRRGNISDVVEQLSEVGCKCYEIGRLTRKNAIRLLNVGVELMSLELDTIRYRLYDGCICKIEDYSNNKTQKIYDDPIEKIEAGIELGFFKSDYSLDSVNGANALYPRLIGKKQLTPVQAVTVIPEYNRFDNVVNLISTGIAVNNEDDFTNAVQSLLGAVLKLVVAGSPLGKISVSIDYLYDPKRDESTRGRILASLLGCAYVQRELTIGCSGTRFLPTEMSVDSVELSSTAVGMAPKDKIITPLFDIGNKIYRVRIPKDEYGVPDLRYVLKLCGVINININTGNITAGCLVEHNEADSVIRGTAGNGYGFTFAKGFSGSIDGGSGDILLAMNNTDDFGAYDCEYLGVVDDGGIIRCDDNSISQREIELHITRFPFADQERVESVCRFSGITSDLKNSVYKTRPNLLILHNDYASEKAVHTEAAILGFDVTSLYVSAESSFTKVSARKVRELIERTDFIVICGRADYDLDGGIHSLLRMPSVLDALNESVFRKGSLVLGTGEGAIALFELGYLTDGNAEHGQTDDITFGDSSMGEMTARIPYVRVEPNNSVLLRGADFLSKYPVGCGGAMMRLSVSREAMEKLSANGQICARFVNRNGLPTETYPCNPEGSTEGITAISSPNGRMLGIFALPEKTCTLIDEPSLMREILESALKYFEPNDI